MMQRLTERDMFSLMLTAPRRLVNRCKLLLHTEYEFSTQYFVRRREPEEQWHCSIIAFCMCTTELKTNASMTGTMCSVVLVFTGDPTIHNSGG